MVTLIQNAIIFGVAFGVIYALAWGFFHRRMGNRK